MWPLLVSATFVGERAAHREVFMCTKAVAFGYVVNSIPFSTSSLGGGSCRGDLMLVQPALLAQVSRKTHPARDEGEEFVHTGVLNRKTTLSI